MNIRYADYPGAVESHEMQLQASRNLHCGLGLGGVEPFSWDGISARFISSSFWKAALDSSCRPSLEYARPSRKYACLNSCSSFKEAFNSGIARAYSPL